MFSIDTWETNNFVWANDNPQNVFPDNSRFCRPRSFANLSASSAQTAANTRVDAPRT